MSALDFEFQPTLAGDLITLRPLTANDFETVYAAASDPLVWQQHPDPLRYQREVFEKNFFSGALTSNSAFVISDNISHKVIGSSRYYEWNAASHEIAIGYTFLARSHWGGIYNQELKRLMLQHAFRWARAVWFHVGSNNLRSRRAVEKIGGQYSHEEIKTMHGVEYPHAYYRIERP